mgnify:CR=1 FL=1|tara:strand:- start:5045 stop:6541 length:1497 start_codon:yes stop_codon:yes gene_type:complete
MMKNFHKKESPLPTLVGLGGGSGGSLYPSLGESYFIGVFGTSSNNETSDYEPAIAIDSSENIYIVTKSYGFYSTTGFNPSPLLMKYNKKGEFQWQRVFHAGAGMDVEDIACDSSGGIYIGGHHYYQAGTGQGSNVGIVVKFNSSGDIEWSRSAGSGSSDEYRGIATDSSDNVYICGYGHSRTGSSSYKDFQIEKWNSSGTHQSTRYVGDNTTQARGWSITIDSSGNYYPCGYISDGSLGVFVGKFNSSHSPSWRKRIWYSGNSTNSQGGIEVDSSGNVYIVGDTNRGSTGSRDMFIMKLDSSGNTSWQRYLGTSSRTTYGRDIAIDNSGNIYVIGFGGIDYDAAPVYPYTNTMDTILIAKYDNSGTIQWKRFLGVMISPLQSGNYTDVEQGRSIKVDPTGKNLYICGQTKNGNFGYGGDDVVWAKLPTDGSGIGTYSGPGAKDIIYGDATNVTSKSGSLSNDSYTMGYGSLTTYAYSNDSVDASYTSDASKTTVEIVT